MSEVYQPLHEALAQEPQNLRDMFRAIDGSEGKLDNCFMDAALGIPRITNSFGREYLSIDTNRPEQGISMDYIYEGTAYRVIRDIMHEIRPTTDDTVYDIGSGYGRFSLYGALTTDATFKGIELVTARHKKAQSIKNKFGISNVKFINQDVLDADMSDGTIFYMFNPFFPFNNDIQYAVENKLRQIADKKPITVVTYAMLEEFEFPKMYPDRFHQTGGSKTGS